MRCSKLFVASSFLYAKVWLFEISIGKPGAEAREVMALPVDVTAIVSTRLWRIFNHEFTKLEI